MRRKKYWTALALLALAPAAQALTLVHTNDILGELEPCGCRTNPLGGLVRKATLLERLKKNDPALLQLDAGDFLFASDNVPEVLAPQSEVQASYLVRAHELMGHDAVTPGEKDFALGLKVFEKLTRKSKIHFLSANLVRKNGAHLLPAHVVFKRGGMRIAVFGLDGDELRWPDGLRAQPAIAAARAQVKALRAEHVDLVVALTHEGFEADQKLAQSVPGIDLIVGGHTQSFLQQPPRINGALIVQSSFRNQYVGVLPLTKPLSAEKYELVGLDAGYDAPGAMATLVGEFKQAVADLNTKQALREEKQAALGGSKQPKFQTFPRCAECHAKQFDFWRQTNHAQALTPLIREHQALNKECLSCHTVGLGDPEGFSDVTHLAETGVANVITPMSTPDLEVFLKAMREARPSAESLAHLHRAWAPVQCENCHSAGRDHPFSGTYTKKVETAVCLTCHTPERAPAWYGKGGAPLMNVVNAKLKSVACPAGELEP